MFLTRKIKFIMSGLRKFVQALAVLTSVGVAASQVSAQTVYSTANGKLFKDGAEIQLFGLNWFGMETPDRVLHGLWTGRQTADFLADIKNRGFNALRIPLSPETINPGFPIGSGPFSGADCAAMCDRDGRTALEYVLGVAQANDIFVLLDFHTCDPARLGSALPGDPIACPGYGLSDWLADLGAMASLSLTYTNVVGIDLANEPHNLSYTEWANLASQGAQAVLAVNPNVTIFVEGVGNGSDNGGFTANWGQNLTEAGNISGIPANRLVFSPHSYGPSVAILEHFADPAYPANMDAIWEIHWGHLVDKGFTVIKGEWGGLYTGEDRLYQDRLVDYLLSKGLRSTFFWSLNPNSGDTGGVYENDWKTWIEPKVTLLQRLNGSSGGPGGGGDGGDGGGTAEISCSVSVNDWGAGFVAEVTVTNSGASSISSWDVTVTTENAVSIGNSWNTTLSASSGTVFTASNVSFNGTLAAGGSTTFGFQGAPSPGVLSCE